MGLLDKFKNLFTEEVEEEERPIKKEVTQVEIPAPMMHDEEAADSSLSESELIRKDEKFKFPVYFDDKDFDTLEKPKDKPSLGKDVYANKQSKKEDKRTFELSPIISPVYGVLDKNYHKEDITNRASNVTSYIDEKPISIDDVRKKAFGTLEDDIENDLFSSKSILFNEATNEVENTTDKDIFDELDFNLDGVLDSTETEKPEIKLDYVIETNIQEEDDRPQMEIDYIMQTNLKDKAEPTRSNNMIEDELTKLVEENDLKEDDLFNLIDSMYEKREDEW